MDEILKVEGLSKQYPGVKALSDVSIGFRRGEVHALMGENGAGKSTLIKMIAGAASPDSGTILIDGCSYASMTPKLAREKGISVIYQEFNLIPSMSVMENLYIGNGEKGTKIVSYQKLFKDANALFENFDLDLDVRTKVSRLSTGQQQIVEIAKALSCDCRVLIMDEPSAALSTNEVERMFTIIRKLKDMGVTILYISHRMDEVFEIADRFSVLRDGKHIVTDDIKNVNREKLIAYMVGRELKETYPPASTHSAEIVLKAEHLSSRSVSDVSFELYKGEILGIAGLIGAGRTELAKLIFGADKRTGGRLLKNGKEISITSSAQAIEEGIMLIPEDRKTEGVFLDNAIDWNIAITVIKKYSRWGVADKKSLAKIAAKYIEALHIKTPSQTQKVRNLSGGNQQKVVIAKALAADSSILIFDEPTRGIDVGAKQEIYKLMRSLAEKGVSIMMISSDMEEVLGMSDRIMVMHEGKQTGFLEKEEYSQEKILDLASGS